MFGVAKLDTLELLNMTENKRFMASINNEVDMDYDVEIWDYNKHLDPSEVVDLLNELDSENKELKLSNRLLLEEMKEIRDKLTIYLEIRKGDFE